MPNLCHIEWPGLDTYWEAELSLGHGTMPGICTIVCPAQNHGIASFGTLVWTDGDKRIELPSCKVDKIDAELTPRGRIWTITILDRRWLWRFGKIGGWYNIHLGNLAIKGQKDKATKNKPEKGKPQKDEKAFEDTERTPQELAELCLKAMGEQNYDVSDMPNDLRPEVRFDPPVTPAEALNTICEMTGCRAVPTFTRGVYNGTSIRRMGFGENLPKSNLEFDPGLDTAELPDKIGVYLAPTLWEVHLPLIPVISSDLFSNIQLAPEALFSYNKHSKNIFNRYPPPFKYNVPVYDPERPPEPFSLWCEIPPLIREKAKTEVSVWKWVPYPQDMPASLRPKHFGNYVIWTRQMQEKLVEEAFRYFQIKLPFEVPGFGKITRHDQYVLETERAEIYEDRQTGVWNRAPAFVYGSYEVTDYGTNSEALWKKKINAIDPNDPLVYQGPFSIDPESRLVRFSEHMIRYAANAKDYREVQDNIFAKRTIKVPPKEFEYEPAALVLVTAIRLLTPERIQSRATFTRDVLPLPKTKPQKRKGLEKTKEPIIDWITVEDLELRNIVKYKTGEQAMYPEPVETNRQNEDDCKKNANYYIDARMQRYQTRTPQRARYMGLVPIQLDGAIEQVAYLSSRTQGSYTIACRHSEWAYGALLPYGQRRQIEELASYKKWKRGQEAGDKKLFRKWTFLPTAHGGVWGLSPP